MSNRAKAEKTHHSGPGSAPALGIWSCYPTPRLFVKTGRRLPQIVAVLACFSAWVLAAFIVLIGLVATFSLYTSSWEIPFQVASDFAKAVSGEPLPSDAFAEPRRDTNLIQGASIAVLVACLIMAYPIYLLSARAFRWLLATRRFSNSVRNKELFVTVLLQKDANNTVTGIIRSKVEWTAYTRAKSDRDFALSPQFATVLQNMLPRIFQMQETARGLLRIDDGSSLKTFTCIRNAWLDAMIIAFFATIMLAFVVSVIVAPSFLPMAVSISGAVLAAVGAANVYRLRSLAASLSVQLEFRRSNNIVDMRWKEYQGLGLGFHDQWSVLHDDQGVAEFCKRVSLMKGSVKLDWTLAATLPEHVELLAAARALATFAAQPIRAAA